MKLSSISVQFSIKFLDNHYRISNNTVSSSKMFKWRVILSIEHQEAHWKNIRICMFLFRGPLSTKSCHHGNKFTHKFSVVCYKRPIWCTLKELKLHAFWISISSIGINFGYKSKRYKKNGKIIQFGKKQSKL